MINLYIYIYLTNNKYCRMLNLLLQLYVFNLIKFNNNNNYFIV